MKSINIKQTPITELVSDGDTVLISGSGGGLLEADGIMALIEKSFLQTGHPNNLTLIHGLGIGDGEYSGVLRFAHEGMLRRLIGGHWSWGPKLQKMCADKQIEGYTLPAGVIITLMREIGAGRPGVITKTGLGTFADPDFGGGQCNAISTEKLVEKIIFNGEEHLWYKPIKIDVAIIRGSYMDSHGNITARHEPADLDAYPAALAAHNSGGKVLAQVNKKGSEAISPARAVTVPGLLVDAYLPHQAPQSVTTDYDPAISGEEDRAVVSEPSSLQMPSGIRGVIAHRAADEIGEAWSVNFGFGIPGGIPAVLQQRGIDYWGTLEQGIHGGDMLDGVVFGSARHPLAIMSSTQQFDLYSGGGIDCAFLGMGEMDQHGNVNVSKLGGYIVGPGGFVDIAQGASRIVFCGTFETKGLKVDFDENDAISFISYGEVPKLVDTVKHITFSGEKSRELGKQVIYVTERAVFELRPEGVTLIEVRSGVDIQKDVLDRMGFQPKIDLTS